MTENILSPVLQAEKEYQCAVRDAVRDAKKYASNCEKKQNAYLEDLKQEWRLFEQDERDNFEEQLSENEKALEADLAERRERLRRLQEKKAAQISDRLKEEVLSLYGDR